MTSYIPETPYLTVDIIVELIDKPELSIVLIERRNPPLGWALPGGFVDIGETIANAARREAKEEISLDVELVTLLGLYSSPDRDPRSHSISAVYIAASQGNPVAADDAKTIRICGINDLPSPIVFDHSDIIDDYSNFKKNGTRPSLER